MCRNTFLFWNKKTSLRDLFSCGMNLKFSLLQELNGTGPTKQLTGCSLSTFLCISLFTGCLGHSAGNSKVFAMKDEGSEPEGR